MDEVRLMGTEGSARIKDDHEEVLAYAFETIFKVKKSDQTAFKKVTRKRQAIWPLCFLLTTKQKLSTLLKI